jgi:hypothetical protein
VAWPLSGRGRVNERSRRWRVCRSISFLWASPDGVIIFSHPEHRQNLEARMQGSRLKRLVLIHLIAVIRGRRVRQRAK